MGNYRVLIIDDEPIQRQIMQEYCRMSGLFAQVWEASDAIAGFQLLNKQPVDLLLLDINLPVLNGLSLVKSLITKPKIIFITAYSEYAVDAFELDVLDYLVKPVAFERFLKAINKMQTGRPTLMPAFTDTNKENTRLLEVKQGGKTFKLAENDILYCESKGNYTRIVPENGTPIDTYVPISKFTENLDPERFIRTHRSFVVNLARVTAYQKKTLFLGEHRVPIGSNYKSEVEKHIRES